MVFGAITLPLDLVSIAPPVRFGTLRLPLQTIKNPAELPTQAGFVWRGDDEIQFPAGLSR